MKKNIFQIYYDAASKEKLDPGFIPLEIAGNPRADWREYWGIREFFLNTTLDRDAYYGFLSPLFTDKTRLTAQQVNALMDLRSDADVFTFSPSMSDAACYLNVFEQGNRRHPGLLAVTGEFLEAIDLPVEFKALVNDFHSAVYCNYIIAKPAFWEKWFAISEALFDIAEQGNSALASALTAITEYGKGAVEMKVFIMERIGSLILALAPELKVVPIDIDAMPYGHPLYYPCRKEMLTLNALKIAYKHTRDTHYLGLYHSLRRDVLVRCDTEYEANGRNDFF